MSESLGIRSELLKLARVLERDPESLSYLEEVPADDIRELRELATDRIYDAGGGVISTLARASKLIPPALTATLATRTFGPVLSARVAGELDPGRAVEVASKLPSAFLAEIAVELDPRRASAVIGRLPAKLVGSIAAELIRSGEHVTMGRFVGHIAPDALQASLAAMSDSDLLEVAFVIEDKSALDGLIDELGLERLEGVLTAAADEELWPEALDLFANLSDARRTAIADAAADADDRVLESLMAAAHSHGLWEAVLPIVQSMSERSLQRLASLRSISEPSVLDGIIAAAAVHGLWDELLPLVPLLPPDAQARVAAQLPAGVQLAPRAREVRSKP
jgi:hypothetical protein